MGNIDDRLRAADLVAAHPYQHPNLDAMVSRITSPSTARLEGQWRLFKLRMASAVAVTSLVMAGAITTLQAVGPSLPVLELSAATHGSVAAPAGSMMMIYEKLHFTAGPDLGSAPSLATAYQLRTPPDGNVEAARLALIFGVTGTPQNVNGDGTDWTVTDRAGDTLVYQSYGGASKWYYNSASSISSSSVTSGPPTPDSSGLVAGQGAAGPVPAQSTVASDAEVYFKMLNYGYSLASPSFSTQAAYTDLNSTSATINEETANYGVAIDGTTTDQSVQFTVDGSNTLVQASGPAFSVASSTNYPLQSPVDGVASLNTQQQNGFAPATGTVKQEGTNGGGFVNPPATTAPTTTDTGLSDGSSGPSTTTTIPSGPPLVTVVLNDVTVMLGTYQLQDGSAWLIPVYQYTGTATNADGSSYPGSWSTVAVDPAYVHLDEAVPRGIVNY
jgi:hypothetical protein